MVVTVAITSAQGASGSRSITRRQTEGEGPLKSPYAVRERPLSQGEMAARCIVWMRGQNANRCASFVSVGTRFLGLFRPKWLIWLKPAVKRKRGFMLILQGFLA